MKHKFYVLKLLEDDLSIEESVFESGTDTLKVNKYAGKTFEQKCLSFLLNTQFHSNGIILTSKQFQKILQHGLKALKPITL